MGGVAEILSQDEINSLLAAISSEVDDFGGPEEGDTPKRGEGRVRPYDFGRPNKLSKDQLRTLQIMHESFARGVATSLSAYLRTFVEAEVVTCDAMLYEEFSRLVSNPGIMAIFSLPPLEGSVVLEVNPDIGFAIIDRLLGGPGTIPKIVRELTELEQPVMRRVVERIMENLTGSWSHVVAIEPQFEQLELNPQFTQLVPPKDMVVVIGLAVSLRGATGRINLCIPYDVIEPIVPKLSAHYLFSGLRREGSPAQSEALQRRLRQLHVPVQVILGEAQVTVGELLNLQVGDYIPLDTKADGALPVLIGSKVKFLARPGRSGSRVAVELLSIVDQEEDAENE